VDQDQESGCPLDEGTDRRPTVAADDQIAFQVAGLYAVLGFRGARVDHHLW
jgi:hypothetical protein